MATHGRPSVPGLVPVPGWRRSAAINLFVTSVIFLLLLVLLCLCVPAGRGMTSTWIFSVGTCDSISRKNFMLHLVANIASTGVLTSSNFFMQLLSSPTRADVDWCHSRKIWLEIGMPSWSNIFKLPASHSGCWLLLFASSIPLHILANSVIFKTKFINSEFSTIVTSDLTSPPGSDGFLPTPLACSSNMFRGSESNETLELKEYRDLGLPPVLVVNETIKWEPIELSSCARVFENCQDIRQYQQVLLLVNTICATDSRLLPPHCYFSTCSFKALPLSSCTGDNCPRCSGSCNPKFLTPEYGSLALDNGGKDPSSYVLNTDNQTQCGDGFSNPLPVTACFGARPEDRCKLGISNPTLAIVTASVMLKLILCSLALHFVSDKSIILTLGDAIESFLQVPDATMESTSYLEYWEVPSWSTPTFMPLQASHSWKSKRRRYKTVISTSSWIVTGVFAVATCLAGHQWLIWASTKNSTWQRSPALGKNIMAYWLGFPSQGRLLPSAVLANAPQLVLSLNYLIISSIIARFIMAQEWALFATDYRPLRVSSPKGEQISQYFFQLPWYYGVSLMAVGCLLHWLLSNSIYVFVAEGGYLDAATLGLSASAPVSIEGASDDIFIGLGISIWPFLAMLVNFILLVAFVVDFAARVLPGHMPIVGSNSISISSCCRAACIEAVFVDSATGDVAVLPGPDCDSPSKPLSQRKLKWGLMKSSDALSAIKNASAEKQRVPRLGFGTRDKCMGTPIDDGFYL